MRCDIPASVYQATFAPNTQWSEDFAQGGEVRDYWQGLARRYEVYQYVKLGHQITRAEWSDVSSTWKLDVTDLTTDTHSEQHFDFVIAAVGKFNNAVLLDYPDLDEFQGLIRHTSNWDPAFDPAGKRVAVIGNGASGIQILPNIQPVAAHIDHYVRSPTWIASSWTGEERTVGAKKFSPEQLQSFKNPQAYLDYRKSQEDQYWRGGLSILSSTEANQNLRTDSEETMKRRLRKDLQLAEAIIPPFPPHCRRLTPGPGYLEAITTANVSYIQTPIKRFTATGIETVDGTHREVDAVFCATGFSRDCAPSFPVVSRGVDLGSAWKPGGKWGFPYTYLGISTPGFPNWGWMLGPHPSGVTGTVPKAMQTLVTYYAKLLRKMSTQGIRTAEPSVEATDDFVEYVNAFFPTTVFTEDCSSWAKSGRDSAYIHGHWPGSGAQCDIVRKEPKWEDWKFGYDSPSGNRFAYLGKGFTRRELDPQSDMTEYLKLPEDVDIRRLHEDWWEA